MDFKNIIIKSYGNHTPQGMDTENWNQFVTEMLKPILTGMNYTSYGNLCCLIRMGIYDIHSTNDEPDFELGFMRNPSGFMTDADYEKLDSEDVLNVRFDRVVLVPNSEKPFFYFGIIELALVYREDSGVLDVGMSHAIYKDVGDLLVDRINKEKGLFNAAANYSNKNC